jgi:hypothetical protein
MFLRLSRAGLAVALVLALSSCGGGAEHPTPLQSDPNPTTPTNPDPSTPTTPAPPAGKSVLLDVQGSATGFNPGKSLARAKAGEPEQGYDLELSDAANDYLLLEATLSWEVAADRFALELRDAAGQTLATSAQDSGSPLKVQLTNPPPGRYRLIVRELATTAGTTFHLQSTVSRPGGADGDGDGLADVSDNCPAVANTDQTDTDKDGQGDACDPVDPPPADADGDGVPDASDNCPAVANTDQTDTDKDGQGDACDPVDPPPADADGDGVPDASDNCPAVANADQADTDGDGQGDVCDTTPDGDPPPPPSESAEARVVVAVIDSGVNPYHAFYNVGSPIYPSEAPPASVTPAVLAEFGVTPECQFTLTRTGKIGRAHV